MKELNQPYSEIQKLSIGEMTHYAEVYADMMKKPKKGGANRPNNLDWSWTSR